MIKIVRFWCKKGFAYNPQDVISWLATLATTKRSDLDENANNGICVLYKKLGIDVSSNQVAGGIRQLLHNPQHASNVVLSAYANR